MIKLSDLLAEFEFRSGRWVPSRPVSGPFIYRLRDAWKVLNGKAEAVQFLEDKDEHATNR